jgi:hypothetical protein
MGEDPFLLDFCVFKLAKDDFISLCWPVEILIVSCREDNLVSTLFVCLVLKTGCCLVSLLKVKTDKNLWLDTKKRSRQESTSAY